jgi:hypothetical protein
MDQNPLTIVARVQKDRLDDLEALLEKIGQDISGNPYIQFGSIPTLHFACMIVLKRDPAFPPTLYFEVNHDGPGGDLLDALLQASPAGVAAVFGHCDDFPPEAATDRGALRQYLVQHQMATAAFYAGCPGHSVLSIQNAMATREKIEKTVDQLHTSGSLAGRPDADVYEKIVAASGVAGDTTGSSEEAVEQTHNKANLSLALWIVISVVLALALWPLTVVLLLVFVIVLRQHEIGDERTAWPALPIDPRLYGKEDIFTQNHLTTLVNVKPGAFRLGTLKGVLWLIAQLARTVFTVGSLGGIPTIHFARWLLIDNDRRLLFFSNYDGSWASYLGDFVDRANYGLTAVWGNTESFPPARFLFLGGAQYIEAFKTWSRQHNEYAAVWYSAYPEATVNNIMAALQLREGVRRPPADLRRWLQSL